MKTKAKTKTKLRDMQAKKNVSGGKKHKGSGPKQQEFLVVKLTDVAITHL